MWNLNQMLRLFFIYITMVAMQAESAPGFVEMCDVTDTGINDGERGIIISPNYPQPYDPGVDCTVYVKQGSDETQILELTANAFFTERNFDFLYIFHGDGSSYIGYTGNEGDESAMPVGETITFNSASGGLSFRFVSDVTTDKSGFNISYDVYSTKPSVTSTEPLVNSTEPPVNATEPHDNSHAEPVEDFGLTSRGATCSASSELAPCYLALDGGENPTDSAWISARDGAGTWIQVHFPVPVTVEHIDILQPCNLADQARQISFTFSDGTEIIKSELHCVGGLSIDDCDNVFWQTFGVDRITTNYVMITELLSCSIGSFGGLREMRVLGSATTNVAAWHVGGTCDTSMEPNPTQNCQRILDENDDSTWLTSGQGIGAWISVAFPRSQIAMLLVSSPSSTSQKIQSMDVLVDNVITDQIFLDCNRDEERFNLSMTASRITFTVTAMCQAGSLTAGIRQVEAYGSVESSGVLTKIYKTHGPKEKRHELTGVDENQKWSQ